MTAKPIIWVGNSLDDLRNFPENARTIAGYNLRLLQNGLTPYDWRPMSSIGTGVAEIRIHTGRQHRVFYIASLDAGIYVLHAFEKKTQRTSKRDLDMGKRRLSEVIRSHSKG